MIEINSLGGIGDGDAFTEFSKLVIFTCGVIDSGMAAAENCVVLKMPNTSIMVLKLKRIVLFTLAFAFHIY